MALDKMLLQMLEGSYATAGLFFITLLLSLPLGLGLMLLYVSKNKIVKNVTGFYILIMRGTPLLLQMFFIYFGLPYLPGIGVYLQVGRFFACAVAFVLNYAAYFAEIFRGGLLAIDQGQNEAAKVLGLNKTQTLVKIILPQMIRVSLPSISNEAIILVKDTSLMTALGVVELLGATKNIVNNTFSVMPFGIAAIFYLVMSWALTLFFRKMEQRYSF
ncbi:MAG: amino acid ABC transporter permease [Clostridiales bacterium]|jgi:polar amino acid transport system permease protein|nr:amino acid ABC transporter permease [Clostridiales bacterium]